MLDQNIVNLLYLVAAILFIYDLKWMSHPKTAVRGNTAGILGMVVAIGATMVSDKFDWTLIVVGLAIGALIGIVAAIRVQMTTMPEMVAIFNGFGGGASILVAGAALITVSQGVGEPANLTTEIATVLSGFIGSVTLFGSYVAFGKLAEFLAVKWKLHLWQRIAKLGFVLAVLAGAVAYAWSVDFAMLSFLVIASAVVMAAILMLKKDRFPGMNGLKWVLTGGAVALGVVSVLNPTNTLIFWTLVAVSGVLGVVLTYSIGGADMPVVIALLNSYSGLAAAATGFVIGNSMLIIAGSLVGASGLILTSIMCKAMNRSLANVLFGTMGPTSDTPDADDVYTTVKATSGEEVAMLLEDAQRVVFVPGYGMAVAQAQHAVRDLANLVESKGGSVEYAIHPVAGRMPGHMNVLLAEADVPYDKLIEMDDINPTMSQVDVAIVIGANDVVNPVAKTDPGSPIAGMPIINVDAARTAVIIKRSLSPGFAGIPNPLFAADRTLMLFGDGKKMIMEITSALKES